MHDAVFSRLHWAEREGIGGVWCHGRWNAQRSTVGSKAIILGRPPWEPCEGQSRPMSLN